MRACRANMESESVPGCDQPVPLAIGKICFLPHGELPDLMTSVGRNCVYEEDIAPLPTEPGVLLRDSKSTIQAEVGHALSSRPSQSSRSLFSTLRSISFRLRVRLWTANPQGQPPG